METQNADIRDHVATAMRHLYDEDHLPGLGMLMPMPKGPGIGKRFTKAAEYLRLIPSPLMSEQEIEWMQVIWAVGSYQPVLLSLQRLRQMVELILPHVEGTWLSAVSSGGRER